MSQVVRRIIHVDMDAFFAAVEQRDNPNLRGQPVIVGGSPQGRGVVAAASYEARHFGIKSAMPCAEAYRRCPRAVFLPPDMAKYQQVSAEVMQLLGEYTPLVEPISVDEAFLDVTGSHRLFGSAHQIGQEIRSRLSQTLKLTASVGVAPNKFLAKLASDQAKPDGLLVVEEGQSQDFLAPLPVSKLGGVGETTAGRLRRMGLATVGELRTCPLHTLVEQFGKQGQHLHDLAHGHDDSPLQPRREPKSVSHETTFERDTSDPEFLEATLLELSERVGERLRTHNLSGRTITLKVRFADFSTLTRSNTLSSPIDSDKQIYDSTRALLNAIKLRRRKIRLLGVAVSNFGPPPQPSLFEEASRPQSSLDEAVDAIRQQFGPRSVRRARLLEEPEPDDSNRSD